LVPASKGFTDDDLVEGHVETLTERADLLEHLSSNRFDPAAGTALTAGGV